MGQEPGTLGAAPRARGTAARGCAWPVLHAGALEVWPRAPVSDEVLLRAFLDDEPFLISGPPRWNPLGLGSTAMFASTLVYNTRRTGDFTLAGHPFVLRRVYFPKDPSLEWFVVDLLKHHDMAGVALSELRTNLVATLRLGRWNVATLREMAATYGTKSIAALIEDCIVEARAT